MLEASSAKARRYTRNLWASNRPSSTLLMSAVSGANGNAAQNMAMNPNCRHSSRSVGATSDQHTVTQRTYPRTTPRVHPHSSMMGGCRGSFSCSFASSQMNALWKDGDGHHSLDAPPKATTTTTTTTTHACTHRRTLTHPHPHSHAHNNHTQTMDQTAPHSRLLPRHLVQGQSTKPVRLGTEPRLSPRRQHPTRPVVLGSTTRLDTLVPAGAA